MTGHFRDLDQAELAYASREILADRVRALQDERAAQVASPAETSTEVHHNGHYALDGHRHIWQAGKCVARGHDPIIAAPAEGLDVHAALNTYESSGHEPTIVAVPSGVDVHGANGRRLLVREMDDGVWIGGCLITDPFVLGALVSYLQSRADTL